MPVPGASGLSFSVARLLTDLPRERLIALETVWGLDHSSVGAGIAALYRRMTDARLRDEAIARLPDATRLVFPILAKARKPLTLSQIGRAVPFSEDDIERSLTALEATGLVWRSLTTGRDRSPGERRWFVPLEMCDRPSAARPRATHDRTSDGDQEATHSPEPRPLATPPKFVGASDFVAPVISALLGSIGGRPTLRPSIPVAVLSYAEHCGIALGVLKRWHEDIVAGPRADAWRQAGPADQRRALARLWLVDERSHRDVPAWVRRRLWDVLKTVDRSAWYDLSSVARRMAWRAAATGASTGEATIDQTRPSSKGLITRRDVDQAVEVLGWIGVLTIGTDGQGRPIAIRVGEYGEFAVA